MQPNAATPASCSRMPHLPASGRQPNSPQTVRWEMMLLRSMLRSGQPVRSSSASAPGDIIRSRIGERGRLRRRKRDPASDEFFVQTPESAASLDTATMPMVLTAVAVSLSSKLLMMV